MLIAATTKSPIVPCLTYRDAPAAIEFLCKAFGFSWATARAVISSRPDAKGSSIHSLDAAYANFEKLAPATAQRVVRFWQVREPVNAA